MCFVTVPASLFVDERERVGGDGGVLLRVVVAADVLGYLREGSRLSVPLYIREAYREQDGGTCLLHTQINQMFIAKLHFFLHRCAISKVHMENTNQVIHRGRKGAPGVWGR